MTARNEAQPDEDMVVLDASVVRDARRMLEHAARVLETLEHADTATHANRTKYASKLSDVLANLHAAQARLT